MLKISLLLKKFTHFTGQITREFLGLRMRNFQSIVFIRTQTCRKIFKSALVHMFLNTFRNIHRRCSVRKGVIRNFTKFTGEHLCQSLFFNKVAG